jgi:hypothetical protein
MDSILTPCLVHPSSRIQLDKGAPTASVEPTELILTLSGAVTREPKVILVKLSETPYLDTNSDS